MDATAPPSTPAPKAGLYVHFPFCRRKCPYCHFVSRPFDEAGVRAWTEGILKEAESAARHDLFFDTLYFGGGTPSLLPASELNRLILGLRERLRLEPVEVTLEANPSGGMGPDVMKEWSTAGVTRLSVGAQSFDDAVLRVLEPESTAAEAEAFVARAVESGLFSVGLDLMAGVPGETAGGLDRTLAAVGRLRPDHVSAYLLENVEGLPFEDVLRERPVEDDAAADSFERLEAGLEARGLRRYEISNFARPGRACRHNLKYWRYESFVGLGPSAASHVGRERWANADGFEEWRAGLERGGDPRRDILLLSAEDEAREALAAGLRLVEGVDLADLSRRFGIEIASRAGGEIERLAADGFLTREGDRIRIPEEKLLVSNAVIARLI